MCSNQTVAGLKAECSGSWRPECIMFKSDRGGIERHIYRPNYMSLHWVQIRPWRDWKSAWRTLRSLGELGSNQTVAGLKVAIFTLVYTAMICSNQTVAGLKEIFLNSIIMTIFLFKSDRGGIESNDRHYSGHAVSVFKSDRGGIERCPFESMVTECIRLQVQIRPWRDWKDKEVKQWWKHIKFKSDRGGIERERSWLTSWVTETFKSDRGGIERSLRSRSRV